MYLQYTIEIYIFIPLVFKFCVKWQEKSDKASITNLARRLRRLTQILLRYKNILVQAMPAYKLDNLFMIFTFNCFLFTQVDRYEIKKPLKRLKTLDLIHIPTTKVVGFKLLYLQFIICSDSQLKLFI